MSNPVFRIHEDNPRTGYFGYWDKREKTYYSIIVDLGLSSNDKLINYEVYQATYQGPDQCKRYYKEKEVTFWDFNKETRKKERVTKIQDTYTINCYRDSLPTHIAEKMFNKYWKNYYKNKKWEQIKELKIRN